jgi:flagellar hook protein FlgE
MASTTALFTGLTGLSVNARKLDVIGNNIANVNTAGYKSSRMMFKPAFTRNLTQGTAPSGSIGGTNPTQVGLGATISGTQRSFVNGSISPTGIATDVGIEGEGLFVLEFAGEQIYSRAGAFQLNESSQLVTLDGATVLGFGVDELFQVVEGTLSSLTVPVGSMSVAEATRNVTFRGNMNASGDVATTGTVHAFGALYQDAGLTTPATAALDLTMSGTDLYIDDGAGGSFLAIEGGAGTIISIGGGEKGGKEIPSKSFAFSGTAVAGVDDYGTTLQDFMDFLTEVLGLTNATVGGQQLGGAISMDAGGVITITGNEGVDQALTLESADLVATNNGSGINQPFVVQQTGEADGESVRTSFVVYDSLGSAVTVDLTFVLQETVPGSGTIWTYIAESSDTSSLDRVVGLGTVEFDANGEFQSALNQTFSILRDNGAVSPLTVSMEFNATPNSLTALTTTNSILAAVFQDGSPLGTLSSFAITETGIISGAFSNGLTRNLGQVALAQFTNPGGLVDIGNNNFRVGPNSGDPLITTPLSFGTGRLIGGALELSNVDLSNEFINMILASTGYSAASRVITTTDELLDQLLLLGR